MIHIFEKHHLLKADFKEKDFHNINASNLRPRLFSTRQTLYNASLIAINDIHTQQILILKSRYCMPGVYHNEENQTLKHLLFLCTDEINSNVLINRNRILDKIEASRIVKEER